MEVERVSVGFDLGGMLSGPRIVGDGFWVEF